MVKQKELTILLLTFIYTFLNCKGVKNNEDLRAIPKTPVTVAEIERGNITETIPLNATSVFQKKHIIKAFFAGYVNKAEVVVGQQVKKGQLLFTLTTKESAAYNSLNLKDTSFIKPKDLEITSTADGVINSVSHQTGEFAQEGDELCTIADPNSMVFVLDLPYEFHQYAKVGDNCTVKMPDGAILNARVFSFVPRVDNSAQTQSIIIKCTNSVFVPENLVVTVLLQKSMKQNALMVPKDAVLSNESQSAFWVMRLINDSTAIKELIIPGAKNQNMIELKQSNLTVGTRILTGGNYGLNDTAKVKIISKQ